MAHQSRKARVRRVSRWLSKFTLPAVIGLLVFALLVFFVVDYDSSLRKDFVSNSLATLLGVAVGVPVGFWVAEHQERRAEAERRNKVLGLLRGELIVTIGTLSGWGKHAPKPIEASAFSEFLRDDRWAAFADGGELECIREPELLASISDAYTTVRMVKSIADKYFNIVSFGSPGSPGLGLTEYLRDMLERGIQEALADVDKAARMIKLPGDKPSVGGDVEAGMSS